MVCLHVYVIGMTSLDEIKFRKKAIIIIIIIIFKYVLQVKNAADLGLVSRKCRLYITL